MVYGGIVNLAPTPFKTVKHHVKTLPCGGTTSVVSGDFPRGTHPRGPWNSNTL